jgi:hypothetical protein
MTNEKEPQKGGIPESTKQKKRLGKERKFSEYFELKVEVARELGLLEKVKKHGWGGLSAEESGRLGGYMTRELKQGSENEERHTDSETT